jgi:hypothetical protein
MGGEVETSGEVRILAWISSATRISWVAMFRNGEFLNRKELGEKQGYVELVDRPGDSGKYWYSITVEAESPFFFQPILCHSSPFFVTFEG